VYALSFDYGQRHRIELERAAEIAHAAGAREHRTVRADLAQFGGSALTADLAVPKGRSIDEKIPITYVPARNTVFLALALAYAETIEARDIFLGINALDYSGYPDCRPEYLEAFERLANLATRAGVEADEPWFRLHAPLLRMTKADIVRTAAGLSLDLSRTVSCYDPGPAGEACGQCDSCRLRAKGFAEAGRDDPALSRMERS
jgi:7-cyano-7-deazaguanine synthase